MKYCNKCLPRTPKQYSGREDDWDSFNEFNKYVLPNVEMVAPKDCDSCSFKIERKNNFKQKLKELNEDGFRILERGRDLGKLAIQRFKFNDEGGVSRAIDELLGKNTDGFWEVFDDKSEIFIFKHIDYEKTRIYRLRDGKLRQVLNLNDKVLTNVKRVSSSTIVKVEKAYLELFKQKENK